MNIKKIIEVLRYKKKKAFLILSKRLISKSTSPFYYIWYSLKYSINFQYAETSCKISEENLQYISERYIEAINSENSLGKAGGLWESIISDEYSELHKLLVNKDVKGLSNSLKTFGSNSYTRGISLIGDIPKNLSSKVDLLSRFASYSNQYKALSTSNNVTFPHDFGGIHGATIGGKFLQVSTLRHNYYAEKINALLNVKAGDVLEIGGGYGGVCYQTLSKFRLRW